MSQIRRISIMLLAAACITMTSIVVQAAAQITFSIPNWTNKEYATIGISVDTLPDELYARMDSENQWIDITNDSNYKVKNNGLLYVKAVHNGVDTIQSEYVGCFDRTAPEVTYTLNRRTLDITVKDDDSGVYAIYVGGSKITSFHSGSTDKLVFTDYTLPKNDDQTVMIYAEDYAGNISKTQTVRYTASSSSSSTSNSNKNSNTNTGTVGSSTIDISAPDWTSKNSALVKVTVRGNNIDYVEAKTSRNGKWFSITSTMDFEITENTDIYVRTTDTDDAINTVSQRIDCFDRVKPTVTLVQDGNTVNVAGFDFESGVKNIYVNGKVYNTDNATVSFNEESKLFAAQAMDHAGNLSETVYLRAYKVGNTSAGGSTTTAAAAPEVEEKEKESVAYYITLNGEHYTLEELQDAGIPIYIMPDVDEDTLAAMMAQYSDLNKDTTADTTIEQPEDLSLETSTEVQETEIESAPVKKSSSLTTIFLIIVGIIATIIIFIIRKQKKMTFKKGDMFETEYQDDEFATDTSVDEFEFLPEDTDNDI